VAPDTTSSAEEILGRFLAAMKQVESFHFEIEGSIKLAAGDSISEIPITFVGDFKSPDRVRGKLAVSLGFFALEMETIVIGDTTYSTNVQTGKWEIAPGLAAALPNPAQFTESAVPALGNPVLLGTETLNGNQVYDLRGVPPPGIFAGPDGKVEFWLSADSLLIVQIAIEGDISLESAGGAIGGIALSGTAPLQMTMRLSAFGEPVEINAPEIP
jgi:hypothetical protein